MVLLLTIGVFGVALLLLSIALLITGENKVHSSCSSTSHVEGVDNHCDFCPNDAEEDQVTALSKAGYPGREDIVSPEVYEGAKKRNVVVERLKYNSGRD